jgi:hypothetical protein
VVVELQFVFPYDEHSRQVRFRVLHPRASM